MWSCRDCGGEGVGGGASKGQDVNSQRENPREWNHYWRNLSEANGGSDTIIHVITGPYSFLKAHV